MEGFGVECRGLFTDMGHFRSPCCGACSPSVENLSLGNYGNSEEPTTYFPTSGTTIPPLLSLPLCQHGTQQPQHGRVRSKERHRHTGGWAAPAEIGESLRKAAGGGAGLGRCNEC